MSHVARVNDIQPGDAARHGEHESAEIAREHYENFNIGAFFLSKRVRQDLYNIYAFCRLADDLADEYSGVSSAEEALDSWESMLDDANRGVATMPLFVALGNTIRNNELSIENFKDLLKAFRWDIKKTRWDNWQELREYTKLSADPVGRIVLELHDCRKTDYFALSDNICTALQLANHWQDVAEDFVRGRIYLPVDDMKNFGVSEDDFARRNCSKAFIELMKFEVNRARELFKEGMPLLNQVDHRLRMQLALYIYGGIGALDAIERAGYDVLNNNAKLSRTAKLRVLIKATIKWLSLLTSR